MCLPDLQDVLLMGLPAGFGEGNAGGSPDVGVAAEGGVGAPGFDFY
jgi:hypothetical protein